MTLGRLKWTFLWILVVLFVFVEYGRYHLYPFFDSWSGRLVMDLVILVGSVFFFGAVFDVLSRLHQQRERQNRELLALHRAALDIYGELSLETVLQKVVDQARQLLEAKYGAVAVYNEKGEVRQFITSGIGDEERSRIGSPPEGRGLLGTVLREGQRLRLPDVVSDPRSVGFPPHHPRMHTLLAVPILCKSPFRGNLYVAEKKSTPEFSAEDEESLIRFATSAAIAIDNAHLHHQLRNLAVAEERVRIAREIHDGLAQILAYVNTKAQAVKEYLQRDRVEEASRQLEQLAAAARDVYTDAREGIVALRTQVGPDQCLEEALGEFIDRWEKQSGIVGELKIHGEITIAPTIELQLLRIIQEALSNARKHSGAHHARVELRQNDRSISASVEDDGTGFDPAARARAAFPQFGLAIMKERAESIGGSLDLDSSPGNGTKVKIDIPLTAEQL
jgi:signal transduction histidine kinase